MESPHTKRTGLEAMENKLTSRYGGREAKAIARLLMEFFNGEGESRIFHTSEHRIQVANWKSMNQATQRILDGEPVQYVLGEGHFFGREFLVTPDVLIPRGETESLVKTVLEAKALKKNPQVTLLEIGTGSGCIAITLALELGPNTEITAIDISDEALTLAKQNAKHMVAEVSFYQMDIMQADANAFKNLDIIVSNPPYVTESEKMQMEPHVLEHEPSIALFVPDEDPLVFYRAIAERGLGWLSNGGQLFVEINEAYGEEVKILFSEMGYTQCIIHKDIHDKDRIVVATNP